MHLEELHAVDMCTAQRILPPSPRFGASVAQLPALGLVSELGRRIARACMDGALQPCLQFVGVHTPRGEDASVQLDQVPLPCQHALVACKCPPTNQDSPMCKACSTAIYSSGICAGLVAVDSCACV